MKLMILLLFVVIVMIINNNDFLQKVYHFKNHLLNTYKINQFLFLIVILFETFMFSKSVT